MSDPEQTLREWADTYKGIAGCTDTLNAVADLQRAITVEDKKLDDLGIDDDEWLDFYRSIIIAVLRTFPDKANDAEAIQGLQRTATDALHWLHEAAEAFHKGRANERKR